MREGKGMSRREGMGTRTGTREVVDMKGYL